VRGCPGESSPMLEAGVGKNCASPGRRDSWFLSYEWNHPSPLLSCSPQTDPVPSLCSPPGTQALFPKPPSLETQWLPPNFTSLLTPAPGDQANINTHSSNTQVVAKFYCKITNQYIKRRYEKGEGLGVTNSVVPYRIQEKLTLSMWGK
jgi:hypothetical protein